MHFIFGRGWVYQDETADGGAAGGGAASGAGDEGGTDLGEGDPGEKGSEPGAGQGDDQAAAAAAAQKKEEKPQGDMKDAIDAALGYKPAGDAAAKKKQEEDAAAAAGTKKPQAAEAWPNGKPRKSDKGEDLDDKGQVVKPKAKTTAELTTLSDADKKALGPAAQARFHELSTALKERDTAIAAKDTAIKGLSVARDALLGIMQETNTTKDDLAALLEFNGLQKSGNRAEVEDALKWLDGQRVALLTRLGREDAGVDLLKDFPDLTKQVEDEEITRTAALEIATGRRDRAARQRAEDRGRQHDQTAVQRKQVEEKALTDIDAWTKQIAAQDLDYKAKEDRLLAKVAAVIKEYQPHQWLPTLKMLYEGIVIERTPAPAAGDRLKQPLRPSGGSPGAPAPKDMKEAIDQGLGYAKG